MTSALEGGERARGEGRRELLIAGPLDKDSVFANSGNRREGITAAQWQPWHGIRRGRAFVDCEEAATALRNSTAERYLGVSPASAPTALPPLTVLLPAPQTPSRGGMHETEQGGGEDEEERQRDKLGHGGAGMVDSEMRGVLV